MRKGTDMTKRRFPLFYIIYFSVIAVAVIAIIIGMGWLKGLLAEYENAQPDYVAEDVFNKYYKSGSFDLLAELTYDEASFDDVDTVAGFLTEQYGDAELTYNSVSSGEEGVLKYIVKSGDYKISSFTLKKSGEKTKRGFDLYTEDSFEVFYAADKSASVLVPEFSEVYLNGKKLGDEQVRDSGIIRETADSTPEGINPIQYTRYFVDGLINDPEIKVMTGETENALHYNTETKEYEAGLPNDPELEAEHKEFVLAAVKEYAKYMEMDSWWGRVKPYFDPTTDLYVSIYTVEQYFVYPHEGYRFEDEYAGEFYAYDEDTFSCRVSVLQVLENPGMEDFKDKIDMTVYVRRVGGKFLIYDWNVIGE